MSTTGLVERPYVAKLADLEFGHSRGAPEAAAAAKPVAARPSFKSLFRRESSSGGEWTAGPLRGVVCLHAPRTTTAGYVGRSFVIQNGDPLWFLVHFVWESTLDRPCVTDDLQTHPYHGTRRALPYPTARRLYS